LRLKLSNKDITDMTLNRQTEAWNMPNNTV